MNLSASIRLLRSIAIHVPVEMGEEEKDELRNRRRCWARRCDSLGRHQDRTADNAQAIKLVNEAPDRYFVGDAALLRRLVAVETALSSNAKVVNIIGEMP